MNGFINAINDCIKVIFRNAMPPLNQQTVHVTFDLCLKSCNREQILYILNIDTNAD